MRTTRLVVPVSLLSVVEVDMPDVGDVGEDGAPAEYTVRFGEDAREASVVTVHAPVVPVGDAEEFIDEQEQARVARLAAVAVIGRAMVEQRAKYAALVKKADTTVPALPAWGQTGEA